ncbi:hypothetical protein EVAR_6035_1 [Eumeta japonica]|uniref:Uncharacterized protein n=1 Tax=Eumeta variegata TaxID=151549 RepID=A0A4C1TAP1_EUMVA|nr:hypothetical protein EVAR_6035_1 [Eumeta japonica]
MTAKAEIFVDFLDKTMIAQLLKYKVNPVIENSGGTLHLHHPHNLSSLALSPPHRPTPSSFRYPISTQEAGNALVTLPKSVMYMDGGD